MSQVAPNAITSLLRNQVADESAVGPLRNSADRWYYTGHRREITNHNYFEDTRVILI